MTELMLAPDDLKMLVDEIWSSLFDPAPVEVYEMALRGSVMAGSVEIFGGWHGRVVVETSPEGAIAIASSLLNVSPHEIVEADLDDAVGELANIVGGSVKSCVEGHSSLSLPQVVMAEAVAVDCAEDPLQVTCVWYEYPLRVSVETLAPIAREGES
jgi:chemotaxis protein CheX